MAETDNETILRRDIEELWNQGSLDLADELYAQDVVDHDPSTPDMVGIPAFKQFVELYRTAFPDLHFTISELIAKGDTVIVSFTASGTHQGPLQGIPPTGRRVEVPVAVVKPSGTRQDQGNLVLLEYADAAAATRPGTRDADGCGYRAAGAARSVSRRSGKVTHRPRIAGHMRLGGFAPFSRAE
jgi:predicted ester cyclase